MTPNAPHNLKKLAGTQWTAVNPEQRRKHWEVVSLAADGQEAVLRAVIDGHHTQIPWRQLRQRQHWMPGWVDPNQEAGSVILSFEPPSAAQSWKTVDDVVMGGRSSSQVRWLPEGPQAGMLRFEGEVSLENHGGFCSTRNQGQWDLSGARELILTLRGTEREFMATIRDADTPEGASFRHPFSPTLDEWQQLKLPLDDFRLFRRGKKLSDEARVDPSQIHSFGFLLADRRSGSFYLEIKKLRA